MYKILFVCHGNICRSPMAELVLKDMAQKAGLSHCFEIASCATSAEELGNPIYPPARRELNRHGIICPHRAARTITRQDLSYYDHIYYMDSRNKSYLSRLFPGEDKFKPLLCRDVADPYYSGDFTQTWLDIEEGCRNILEALTK